MPFSKENRHHTLNGILFIALFGLSSLYLAEIHWIVKYGISSLVIAILLGIFYGNTLRQHLPVEWNPGIQFSSKQLLRLAIILYGFRVTFQEIASIGLVGLFLDIAVVSLTLILGSIIGTKLFKLDRDMSILISAGAAICGAAAVLATEDVLKSEPYKTTVAIGTVVLFGVISMFFYPFLQNAGILGFNESQFGLFAGASIHEVAQVVVAGTDVSAKASAIAVIVKMTRVLLLVPALIFLSLYINGINRKTHKSKLPIPWFAIIFLIMIGFNSLHLLAPSLVAFINQLDLFLLTMAMAAIGIETNLKKIKKVGLQPLYLATFLFLWLWGSVYCMVKFI